MIIESICHKCDTCGMKVSMCECGRYSACACIDYDACACKKEVRSVKLTVRDGIIHFDVDGSGFLNVEVLDDVRKMVRRAYNLLGGK